MRAKGLFAIESDTAGTLQLVLGRLAVLDVEQLDVKHEGGTWTVAAESEVSQRKRALRRGSRLMNAPPGIGPTPREP